MDSMNLQFDEVKYHPAVYQYMVGLAPSSQEDDEFNELPI
jgi:hypothetical protein